VNLTKDQASELAWGGAVEGLEYVGEMGHGARRWTETMWVVFRKTDTPDAELWAFKYERGLTEGQETEIEACTAFRVEPVAVTTITYKAVR